ncbi:hypothetical protein BDF14DRAFT_1834704 [Spinellus fusiger]|nr:hypothetical protein BDF14DRAFT_1834704 [Spinellus fusiger]
MSFANMASGADCSGGANPMNQMLKQFGQDRSLERDRYGTPGPSTAGPSSMRTHQAPLGVLPKDTMMKEFFGQEQRPIHGSALGGNFQFSELERELNTIQRDDMWGHEFNQGPKLWEIPPNEEAMMEEVFQKNMARTGTGQDMLAWKNEFMNHAQTTTMSPQQLAEFENAFQKHFDWAGQFAIQDKGKERSVELNNATWEDQFAAFDKPETEEDLAQKLEEAATKDPAMMDQFESVWKDIRDQMANDPTGIDTNDWEDEFGNFSNYPVYKPDLGDYVFEVNNPYLTHADPLSEALVMAENGSSLSTTALAFEAALQRDPMNSDVWMQLGTVQAQNEKEEPAIRAFEKSIELNPGNLNALMCLAVSYTNESYDHASYQILERWITERYPEFSREALPYSASPYELHTHVTDMFLAAARQAPDGAQMDPDVQVGLGVLFYGSGDLDKAIDCFVVALKGRPNDYLLWNRLGATLANSGRSEEAIDAYHKALEYRPSFVRARYNLGVSCINIGCYKEAAEHLLTGLSMHKRSEHDADEGMNVSNNLWEMLRKAFLMMDRKDLADQAIPGANMNQFRPEFEF